MAIFVPYGAKEWDAGRSENQCAYCSEILTASTRSKEDFWPTWLQRKFPHMPGEWSAHYTRSTYRPDRSAPRQVYGFRQKLKVLCKKCNNGFGSRIQAAAKPAIYSALSRDFKGLSWKDLKALSRWATMLAMTWEFADYPSKAITQTTREQFREYETIPPNVAVCVGNYGGVGFQLNQQHLDMRSIGVPGGPFPPEDGTMVAIGRTEQFTTIGLGSIFWQSTA